MIANVKTTKAYEKFRAFRNAFRLTLHRRRAARTRARSKAKFIAVTGSSGKSSTVALLHHILSATGKKVRTQSLNMNTMKGISRFMPNLDGDEDYVVVEIGTRSPGTIKPIAKLVKPDIAVVTLVALEHYSAFRSLQKVATEKSELPRSLNPRGLAILNADDPNVSAMSSVSVAPVVSFGEFDAKYVFADIHDTAPGALAFTLQYPGGDLQLQTRLTGRHNCVAVSAAAACALELGVSEQTVAQRVSTFEPVFGRLSFHRKNGGPIFLLDTAKAPHHSLLLAINVLRNAEATRKRFILGNISDYAGNSRPKYRDACRAALAVSDQVLIVGPNSKRSKASKEDFDAKRILAFPSVSDASSYVRETAIENELIVIKSSQSLHLERIMLDYTLGVQCWANECGQDCTCCSCGLFTDPFHKHGGKRRT